MSEWRILSVAELAAKQVNALATGPFGSSIGTATFQDHGVPVLRGSNLTSDVGHRLVEDGLVFVSPELAARFSRSIARRGDLVFTCWGTIGQVGLIDSRSTHSEYVVSNKQMKLTPDPNVADSLFLYYAFSGPELSGAIVSQGIGSSVPGFNLGQLRDLKLTLPPLPVQRAIAATLGALDDKIELNRQMNETLEALARALFKSWFVDFDPVRAKMAGRAPFGMDAATAALFPPAMLHGVPDGWRRQTLGELVDTLSGGTPSKSEPDLWTGDIPWVSPKSMTEIYADQVQDHVARAAIGNGTRVAPAGSTLVMVRGMGLHECVRVSQVRRNVTFNQDVKALVPRHLTPALLLMGMLDAQTELLGKVESSGHGTGKLPSEILLGYALTLPPLDAQRPLSEVFQALLDRIAAARDESRTLAELRDLLLPKLLSGELRIKDAEKAVEAVI